MRWQVGSKPVRWVRHGGALRHFDALAHRFVEDDAVAGRAVGIQSGEFEGRRRRPLSA